MWLAPRAHPLVGVFLQASASQKVSVATMVGGPALAYMSDHRVNSRALLPGTGFMELSAAASRTLLTEASNSSMLAVGGVSIRFPLELPDAEGMSKARTMGPAIQFVMDMRASKYEVQSAARHASSAYVSGQVLSMHVAEEASLQLVLGASRPRVLLSQLTAGSVAGRGGLPSAACVDLGVKAIASTGYHAHPAAMDNGMQLSWARVLGMKSDGKSRVPAGVGAFVTVGHACASRGWSGAWSAPAVSAEAPVLSEYYLQEQQKRSGAARVAGLEEVAGYC